MSIISNLQFITVYYQPSDANPVTERTQRTKRGITNTAMRWREGVITVSLDLHNKKSVALMVDAIREWAHHTPALRFKIVEGKRGDIRITDSEDYKGNWSLIGTYAQFEDQDKPTMHLNKTDDSKKFHRAALHEFGHALGFEHEHQHPQNTLEWNKSAAHAYYGSDDVSNKVIDEQILNTLSGVGLQFTPYDTQSVMHYPIPAYLTNSGHGVPLNTSLSKGDQEAAQTLYNLAK